MIQYIDKSALVAKIWERRTKHFNFGGSPSSEYCHEDDEILRIINTLEVKEISDEYDGILGKELKMIDDEIAQLDKLKVKDVNLEKNMKVYRIQCNTVDEDGTSYSFLPGIYISSEIAEKHKPEDYEWPWEEVTYEVIGQEIIEE